MEKRRRGSKRLRKVEAWIEYYRLEQERRVKAVTIIQKAWRRWLDLGVFGYYKELIGFRRSGEPCQLMKCIEPRELSFPPNIYYKTYTHRPIVDICANSPKDYAKLAAKAELLDAAAGVHIRFRLGGLSFPPNIYYKIYTHRPIVDICANSPKDYAKLAAKKAQLGKQKKEIIDDHCGWYKRIENNGWRLLSVRFWKALDPLTAQDNVQVKKIHICKMRKKQEVEKIRKLKKIKWLKQMYFGEKLQVRTLDPNMTIIIQRIMEGFCNSVADEFVDSVMEWEVDEMIKWTTALNYEDYVKQWKELGTSNISEAFRGFQFIEQSDDSLDISKLPDMLRKIEDSQDQISRRKRQK